MGQSSSSTTSNIKSDDFASFFENFFKDIKMESSTFSQENLKIAVSHLEKGDHEQTVSALSSALRDTENARVNIAVIGEPGSGKSSFINVLWGVGHEEERAAPTGVLETTLSRTPYNHPKLPNVTLWDLPGIEIFPTENYLEKMKLSEYDILIIVSDRRVTLNIVQLVTAIGKMGKKFYFV